MISSMTGIALVAIFISKTFEKLSNIIGINAALLINIGSLLIAQFLPCKQYISSFYFEYYIELVIAILCVGSIFSLEKGLLKQTLPKFIPCIFGAILGACIFSLGNIYLIAFPVVGGGIGMGAVPLSEILSPIVNIKRDELLAYFILVVTIGNIVSIVLSNFVNKLPNFKGIRLESENQKKESADFSCEALFIVSAYMLLAKYIASFLPILHHYAWLVIILLISRFIYCPLEKQCVQLYNFYIERLAYPTLAIIGLCATLTSFPPVSVFLLIISTVIGSAVGAGIVGKLLGLNPTDTGISAGLCMANMSGSGDIAVLGTCNRFNLMPYATISSRIGGALVLITVSLILNGV